MHALMEFYPIYSRFRWKILFTNNEDPDQRPHYVASDLDLYCLPMNLIQVSRKEWVNVTYFKLLTALCLYN